MRSEDQQEIRRLLTRQHEVGSDLRCVNHAHAMQAARYSLRHASHELFLQMDTDVNSLRSAITKLDQLLKAAQVPSPPVLRSAQLQHLDHANETGSHS